MHVDVMQNVRHWGSPCGPWDRNCARTLAALRFTHLSLDVFCSGRYRRRSRALPARAIPRCPCACRLRCRAAPESVRSLEGDAHVLPFDFLDRRALHAIPVAEPVTVPIFRPLIQLGRVEPSDTHFLPVHPYLIAVGHVRLARDRAGGAPDPVRGVRLCDK